MFSKNRKSQMLDNDSLAHYLYQEVYLERNKNKHRYLMTILIY